MRKIHEALPSRAYSNFLKGEINPKWRRVGARYFCIQTTRMLRAWATVQGSQFLQQVHFKDTEKANFRCSPTECPARTRSKPEWHHPTMKKAKLCFSSKLLQGTVAHCPNTVETEGWAPGRALFEALRCLDVCNSPQSFLGHRVFSDAPAGPGAAPRAARRPHRARRLLRPPPAARRVCGPRPRGGRRRPRRRKPPELAPSGQPGPRPLALRTRTEAARVHTPPGRRYSPRRRQRSTPASRDSGWDILPPAAARLRAAFAAAAGGAAWQETQPRAHRGFSAPRPQDGLNRCPRRSLGRSARPRAPRDQRAAAPALTSPPAAGAPRPRPCW